MWQRCNLQLPTTNTRGGNASFLLSGTKIAVHNWTHGKQEASGKYLSPENAAKVIAAKFGDYADPFRPKETVQVVGVLVTATTAEIFIEQLAQLAHILDYSEVKQALSYAKAYENLQTTKMVKMPVVSSPAFGAVGDLTPTIGRMMEQTLGRMMDSLHTDVLDPFALITQLQAVKKAREQANADFLQKVSEMRPLEIWAFQAQGQLDVIAQNLQQNIPTAENIYSFLMFFVGENLSGLQQLLRATDEHNNR